MPEDLSMSHDRLLDCLIVGAGPAGLTAAIYLARFHLEVLVVDAGKSRAGMIPRTHNFPGFPGGVSGPELLIRMRDQASEFGIAIADGLVEALTCDESTFQVYHEGSVSRARTVLLATGVVNNRPRISPDLHDTALARGLLRYCPICDGYEVTDRRIGVIGTRRHGFDEAVFLRMYSRDVTLIAPQGEHALSDEDRERLDDLGIVLVDGPCQPLRIADKHIFVPTPAGDLPFDTVYPALGSVIRSELAAMLGADMTDDGCLIVDDHQRTTIPGLYAAGDVAKGLDQISHAMGQAGVAATTIRNDLARTQRMMR